eukprot:TRINITY_DN5366_c0_g1_i1.p1 TRINITY_DN5366_c0_g1~~TRINITY_DN5366_c0_g1_i1.p1  ORF type:complete len:461 (+),score=48.11 TRINITY_DN5366_c0_g1_i1:32-1384(+)
MEVNSTECGTHVDNKTVSGGLVAMGTILVVVASFISCFGVNLQKWAHNINESKLPENRKPMLKNWRWWLGILAMILGSVMDMAALLFVPLSRVAALGASTIVANIIITPIFLKEKLTHHDFIGCIVTVIGTAVACYFGAGAESDLDSACLLSYFREPLFIMYGLLVALFLLVLFYFIEGFRRLNSNAKTQGLIGGPDQPPDLETVWIHDNLETVAQIPRDKYFVFVTSWGPQFYPCVHAVYAGTIGAQSVMFAKAVLIFLKNSIKNEETTNSVLYLFLFLVPTVFCLWNQIKYLNEALKIYCDAIFVLPVYQALWICTGIASGLIFYKEYNSVKGYKSGLFVGGIVVALLGLGILANRKSRAMEVRTEVPDGKENEKPVNAEMAIGVELEEEMPTMRYSPQLGPQDIGDVSDPGFSPVTLTLVEEGSVVRTCLCTDSDRESASELDLTLK